MKLKKTVIKFGNSTATFNDSSKLQKTLHWKYSIQMDVVSFALKIFTCPLPQAVAMFSVVKSFSTALISMIMFTLSHRSVYFNFIRTFLPGFKCPYCREMVSHFRIISRDQFVQFLISIITGWAVASSLWQTAKQFCHNVVQSTAHSQNDQIF